jgi:hypothetical protein
VKNSYSSRLFSTAESQLLGAYWTSGTNEGYGCDLKHGWCASNTLLTKDAPWRAREPSNLLSERCIQLDFANASQLGLNDVPCSAVNTFICEVKFSYIQKNIKIILIEFYRLECLTVPQFVPLRVKKTFDANYIQTI